jgi:hypothetical protein
MKFKASLLKEDFSNPVALRPSEVRSYQRANRKIQYLLIDDLMIILKKEM